MLQKFFHFLDNNQWACWTGIAVCITATGALEKFPQFPYNLFQG